MDSTFIARKKEIVSRYRTLSGILIICALLLAYAPRYVRQAKPRAALERASVLKTVVCISRLYIDPFIKAGDQIISAMTNKLSEIKLAAL